MRYKSDFSLKTHVGCTAEDNKMIAKAYEKSKELTIDDKGHVYDSTGRWIAEGKERD